ncbi:hypothetical protein Ciccas_004719 [Cichlidogyrus casuarinus]|uniref:Uncharacterized protein n=1 Tax=Cichlidogyrus casuarinus TaxID=1844966 RepID=A0ABD2QBN0_9PLAT
MGFDVTEKEYNLIRSHRGEDWSITRLASTFGHSRAFDWKVLRSRAYCGHNRKGNVGNTRWINDREERRIRRNIR